MLYDDGSSGRIESTTGEPTLTSPGRHVSEVEHEARVDELQAANDAHVAEIQAEDGARQREDFGALAEARARRFSGY
ncbi:hypothetical protein [Streptomyces sp. NRRL S-1824]|uniref:hypothetical protein n=1 Tax=Streptomyces sp. NRRL S-1824 TaxID=1463889 RepID=UPI0004C8FC2D|nr:hypothetical protein [Streptomyces sp. NRRL S-1824]